MQLLTTSMTRAASLTLDLVRSLAPAPPRPQYGDTIRRTLEAYRLQPVSHNSALAPAEAQHAE
jgi:hypothetical protein